MISWHIANTFDPITGSTSSVDSLSIDGTNFFPTAADDTYSASAATTNSSSANSLGTTQRQTITATRNNLRESIQTSTSTTYETITPATFAAETSTTETYESWYDTFATITVVTDGDEVGFVPFWTTSLAEDGAVSFYQGDGTVATSAQVRATSREATRDATTTNGQTSAGRLPLATVYQAEAGEVLYAISNPLAVWGGFSAASNVAQSGTRTTAYASYLTASKITVAGGQTTTATSSQSQSSTIVQVKASTQKTQAATSGQAFEVLPNSTIAITQTGWTTTNQPISTTVFASQQWTVGYAGAFTPQESHTTRSVVSWVTYPTTVFRQSGLQTFQSTQKTSASRSQTVGATGIATSTSLYLPIPPGDLVEARTVGATYQAGANEVVYHSGKLQTATCGDLSRHAFSTTGVVLGTATGGWMSVNGSQSASLFDGSGGYATAYAGGNVGGRTLFPLTNSRLTLNSDSITWTISTAATQGGTTTTTTSQAVQMAGSSLTTAANTAGRIPHAGAELVGVGATLVDTPGQGVYRDQINGETSSFAGNATAYTEGQFAQIRRWLPITYIDFPVAGTNADPIVWAVPRNSTNLPPA
jgi:hypothetical protein